MRASSVTGIVGVSCLLVQCTQRDFNNHSETKDETSGTAVAQVNPLAFNAFDLYRSGQGTEILDYPKGWEVYSTSDWNEPSPKSDGVFYDDPAAWRRQDGARYLGFTGVPTEGARVEGDVLEYPVRNGKQLKLRFVVDFNQNRELQLELKHNEAAEYCRKQGRRLPTARELFDYCATGVSEPNYGPNYVSGRYPSTARCREDYAFWSATLYAKSRDSAWQFLNGSLGTFGLRYNTYPVMCVGKI